MGYHVEHAEPTDGERHVEHVATSPLGAWGYAVGLVASGARLDDGLRIVHAADDGERIVWVYDRDDASFADEVRRWRTLMLTARRPELN